MTSVLFVRLSAMGDLVQGLGAVAALHEVRPDWRLTFVTQTTLVPLLDGLPGVVRVLPFDRHGGIGALRRLRRELRETRYDAALDLQGNWKSAMIVWLSDARRRIGMSPPHRQEPWSRLLLGATIGSDVPPHPARTAMELVRSLAADVPFRLPRLAAKSEEVQREQEALTACGIDWRAPFRVIVVTDPADPRSLRPEVVAAEVARSAEPVVLLVAPDHVATAGAGMPPTLRHGPEPRRLIALGAVVANSGGVVLGPDRGATHVLAAAGARCTVSFGSQDPLRTAPPSARARVHPRPPRCCPCRRRRCNHPSGPVCMAFRADEGSVVATGFPAEDDVRR